MKLAIALVRPLALSVAALAFVEAGRAQCAQNPNECCPPESVDSLFSAVVSDDSSMMYALASQMLANYSNPLVQAPLSPFMTYAAMNGLGTASSCVADPAIPLSDAGKGVTTIDVYAAQSLRLPVPPVSTGLIGLAGLYHSVLVVDQSQPAWNGSPQSLKGSDLPLPYVGSDHLVGEGFGLQPRPGNLPGQYIFECGSDYYQYGGPLETGASPQTTAIYHDSTSFSPPPYLTNQLSGAQLWRFLSASPPYMEVRQVDGSVARFESFTLYASSWTPSGPTQRLWRLVEARDPYDNVATYSYNSINQLTSIAFPSGITQNWTWSTATSHGTTPPIPNWPGWTSGYDRLEISYTFNGTSPTEVAARTWGIVFQPVSTLAGHHFGGRIYRTYSPQRTMLVDLSSVGPYSIGSGTTLNAQVIHEFTYGTSLVQTQRIHTGTSFDVTLTEPSNLTAKQLYETTYSSGRVAIHVRSMTAEGLSFAPASANRTTDLLSEDSGYMSALVVTNGSGTTRRYEFSTKTGRIYSVITTPSSDFAGRPRATHATGENNGIGGVATTDIEPEWMEVYNIYDTNCVCKKPIERQQRSRRNGTTYTRTWNFEYDPTSKLVTKRKEPNPQTGTGVPAQVEWLYSYTQLVGSGAWGAWVPSTETTPDGQYLYNYSDLLTRANSAHGQVARTMTRSLADVRIQSTLTGATVASGASVVETIWRNLSNLPSDLPQMGNVNGQPRKTINGDGVEAVYEYNTAGYQSAMIVGGDLKTAYSTDSLGNVTGTTENALSSAPAATTITLMSGVAAVTEVSSTSAGVTRDAKGYYDRFGHLTVVQQNNLASTGAKPNKYGASGSTARDWVERQEHYYFNRLMETYVDRKPLDEAATGGTLFQVSCYEYAADGRLQSIVAPNGSKTFYDFDGYGTLYRSYTVDPTGAQTVRAPKTFVNPFLELTGHYEYTGTDHLWTLITRNSAGAITQIQEPSTTAPTGYSPVNTVVYYTGGTIHQFQIDRIGRATMAEAYSGSTLLARRELRHDQLSRQIWQRDELIGGTSINHHKAWRYKEGKQSQILSVEETDVAATSYVFNSLGLLAQVCDGFSTGNYVRYTYRDKTPFLESVTRTDIDPSGTPRVTSTAYEVNAFGEVTAVKSGSPQLVNSYAYNSFGRVDTYTDPMRRVQQFLPDALGRIVEHARIGDAGDFILNSATFVDSGMTDGRTKVSRFDGLGNVTITHTDFAGRPFIVQNPGGDVEPTPAGKNQIMSLYAEYDGASRLSALYDGDLGKTEFFRDGPGRVILRRLVNQTVSGKSSQDNITQWNTLDWFRRDGLGRIAMQDYWGTASWGSILGLEQFPRDGLGRLTSEQFVSAFAPAHTLAVNSSFTDGGMLRSGLAYQDNRSQEPAQMNYSRDAIGRLAEVQWDRAPGSVGTMKTLAQYSWAGGLPRERKVFYGNTANVFGRSGFTYDIYGRLTQIKDDFTTDGGTSFAAQSQFDYEYDEASNLKKEKYATVGGRAGDRFAYDAYDRLANGWMGVDSTTMNTPADPTTFSASAIHEALTYSLDHANNRSTTSSQTGSSPLATTYTVQSSSHYQGQSNRYDTILVPGAPSATVLQYDDRGNLKYDGKFAYRYDYMNRLQEVWEVVPAGGATSDTEKFAADEVALDTASKDVKLDIPDMYTRLAHEFTDPVFRSRLRATITGGVVRITPTSASGASAAATTLSDAQLVLAAVYVYDGFNRRTLSVLLGTILESQVHVWDGWRQTSQHKLELVGTTWQATETKQFVWGASLDELVAYRRWNTALTTPAWETYYLLHGGQDTAAKLVDSSGVVVEQYEYDPYGRATCYSKPTSGSPWTAFPASQFGLPFLWKSIRLDSETGLLYMRNRYYSTALGRFLTSDPIGVWGDLMSGGNEYVYAGLRHLVIGDPLGLQGGVHVLITNFEPFGGSQTNNSQSFASEVSRNLSDAGVSNNTVALPVVWDAATDALRSAIADAKKNHPGMPIIVVSVGEAPRSCVEYEAEAKNKRRPIVDNAGKVPGQQGVPTENNPKGAATLPVPSGAGGAEAAGIKKSTNAGQFICDSVAYAIYGSKDIAGGVFIHVPNASPPVPPTPAQDKDNKSAPASLAAQLSQENEMNKLILRK